MAAPTCQTAGACLAPAEQMTAVDLLRESMQFLGQFELTESELRYAIELCVCVEEFLRETTGGERKPRLQ